MYRSARPLICGILGVVLSLPMLAFTAMPSMFFGFDHSDTDEVTQMTGQALAAGGVYLSLEEFESTQIDAIVTSIAGEYESGGTALDGIEVSSSFTQEDLLWMIAIHSVACKQDLNTINAASIRSFCASRLNYSSWLDSSVAEDQVTTILKVVVTKPDPETLMNQLGFDDDAKIWAGAMYELLSESDALTKYASYFTPYAPSYSGDTSYDGGYQYGTEYSTVIDLSGFVSPGTKNNRDLAAYAVQAWENNWGYVWGTFGDVLTPSLFEYKCRQYPDGVGNYAAFIREHWLNRRTTDCVGLIKGYGWLDASTGAIRYGTNGMPDYSANQMAQAIQSAGTYGVDYGSMDAMPEIVGLAVWKQGHIGVYIGNGYVIEAMNTGKGVVKTQVAGRGWSGWGKIPYINYS